jgi:hypothetical protein
MKSLSELGVIKYMVFAAMLFVLAAILSGCSGPRAMSTDSDNFVGINYGVYKGADGSTWELAGGKDGTGVSLKIVRNMDGSTMVEWKADNYDTATVLAQQLIRERERYDAALRAAGLLVTP